MRESSVQQRVRLDAAQLGLNLWRNNNGALQDINGRVIRYGLANESKALNEKIKSSDLIGPTPVTAYVEGWGWVKLAVFTAVETKHEGWKFNPMDEREVAQKAFHDIVRAAGGFAGFATSVEDFRKIIHK